MAKVIISIGHGANTFDDTGSKGVIVNGVVYEEHTFNAIVGMKVKAILENHGVIVKLVQQPNMQDVPLTTRTNIANDWNPDLYLSIHANAGPNNGLAAFYWSTDSDARRAAELYAKFVLEEGLETYSDGSYPSVEGTWSDFHECRVNNRNGIPAILTENGFMTDPTDFKRIFLNYDDFHNVCARINAKTALAYLNIPYKEDEIDMTVEELKQLIRDEMVAVDKELAALPVSTWAQVEWEKAVANGYFDGSAPRSKVTREQDAVVTNRIVDNVRKFVVAPLETRITELEAEIDALKGNA